MLCRVSLLWIAAWTAGCSASQSPSGPDPAKSEIPQAMRGCWELNYAPDEEFPQGVYETMVVKADRIIIDGRGVNREVATIERVDKLTPKLIRGRISAHDEHGHYTVATALELDPQGAPPGTLVRDEGDAGSYDYARCSAAKADQMQRFSLVVAETAHQDDPRPAPCGPTGRCDGFFYRAEWHNAKVLAGAELPKAFDARLVLHTPYISPYRLVLIVERLKDGSLLARRVAGFNGRTGIACFYRDDEWPVEWKPELVAGVSYKSGDLCVFDQTEIDPNAPKA